MSTDMSDHTILKRISKNRPLASRISWLAVAALAALFVTPSQPALAAARPQTLHGQATPSVHGVPVVGRPRPAQLTHGPRQTSHADVHWPAAGTATVDLAAATNPMTAARGGGKGSAASVRAGSLSVWIGPPAGATTSVRAASVRIEDHASNPAAWKDAALLKVARSDGNPATGRVRVSVDYSGFGVAFGADYAHRLRLLAVPDCAMQSPEPSGCTATPLPSTNDPATKTISADVQLASFGGLTTLAVTSGPSSPAGTFTATPLSPSSSWSAGANSGDFSWQYSMATPPSLGGPAATVALSYSSSSVDGRNETTNNQPNWIGEGFDYWPGYISRSYEGCSDDRGAGANNTSDTADLCWKTDNAVLSMSGHAGELIKDDATGVWRLKSDDNTKIERLTDTVNAAWDHEYWKLTTADGTQYFFGLNRPPGYTGTAPANKTTNSVWTVPVAGNHSGEPCHASGFTASFCDQPWRWNLDYVVDPHGNTMSLFYSTETNNYARNNTDTDVQDYIRGGWIDHIDYGTDNRSGIDTEQTSTAAPMRVQFTTADRCLTTCSNHDNWPDTPWDQSCTSSTSCPGLYAPTYFTTKRLASVTTRVWDTVAAAYKDVDQWVLTHTFPPSGDETRDGMWLASIQRTGKATGASVSGSAITLPATSFDWTQMPNRVDPGTDHKPPMNWMRLSTIWTDTGGKIDIRYTGQDCSAGDVPTNPAANTRRCYPVLEEQPDKTIKTEYFHKYLVSQVTQADWSCNPTQTPCSDNVTTLYTYVGNPGWRHTDDDGLTKANLRTWSDFRGYPQVDAQVGQPGQGRQTLTRTTYFLGMNGDANGSGGTKAATLPALDVNGDGDTTDTADAPAVADENAFTGMTRQTTVYNGVDTDPITTTVDQPWQSAPTASRTIGGSTVVARHSATTSTWDATKLAAGGWRVSRIDTTLDSYGMATQVDDAGDVAVTGDERCTSTTYNRNTATNILSLTAEADSYALTCALVSSPGPAGEGDVISMSRTFYDHNAFTTPPTKGEATQQDVAKAWAGGPTWLTQSTATFDAYGRATDVTDVRGNHTTTAYTPTTGGPLTQIATTTTLGTSTTTLEPSWSATTTMVDNNNKRTDATYDALGRTYQVWLPNHLKSSFATQPSSYYAYTVRTSGGSAVTSNTLNAAGGYNTSIAFYDGLLRSRQVQTPSAASGHVGTVFTDILYDEAGRVAQQSTHFDATVQPSTTMFAIQAWQPKTQTVTQYDRAGRTVADLFNSQGIEQWRTTTSYGGDRTNTLPPTGGVATTSIVDAHGRTTEQRQYHNATDLGSDNRSLYDLVTYHYNKKGQQDQVTDNAGNSWTYTYDLLDRRTATHDPDKGDSSSTYNDYGDVLTATDARNTTLAYTYDNLGRKTGEYTPTTSGTKLATWTYDPVGAKGQLSTASRWIGTDEYKLKVNGYTPRYQPTSETYTIPAATDGSTTGISGSYTFSHSYKADGSPATLAYPNAGGLGAETLTYNYDATTGQPLTLQTNFPGVAQYVNGTDYTAYGELSYYSLQATGTGFIHRSFTYEDSTRRLSEALTIRQNSPQAVDDAQYKYDFYGNIIKQIETPASGSVDTQCFEYDYTRRLADAWTPTSGDCNQAKSASALAGPAPYWLTWTYDAVGNRKTQISHATTGDTTVTNSYPAQGASSVRPHAMTSIATVGPGVNKTDNYGYDAIGNTTARPGPTAAQGLTWDTEGHLQKVTEGSATTTYLYGADGTRWIQDDPTRRTLYLPGEEIVYTKATAATTTTRYYTWAGQTIATITTGGQLTWLISDPHGTQQIAVASGTQAITQRRQTPFGTPRGTNPSWPDPHGFVGGTNDPTSLTHLGAREYDPTTGRFISVDPIFDGSDPQSWSGYAYADNAPVTSSDPTGTVTCVDDDIDSCKGGGTGGGTSGGGPGNCDSSSPSSKSASCPGSSGGGTGGPSGGGTKHCGDPGYVGSCPTGQPGKSGVTWAKDIRPVIVKSMFGIFGAVFGTDTGLACLDVGVSVSAGGGGQSYCAAIDGQGVGWVKEDKAGVGTLGPPDGGISVNITHSQMDSIKDYEDNKGYYADLEADVWKKWSVGGDMDLKTREKTMSLSYSLTPEVSEGDPVTAHIGYSHTSAGYLPQWTTWVSGLAWDLFWGPPPK